MSYEINAVGVLWVQRGQAFRGRGGEAYSRPDSRYKVQWGEERLCRTQQLAAETGNIRQER